MMTTLRMSMLRMLAILCLGSVASLALAQSNPSTNLDGFGLKIFKVESGLYPFVQVYLRTFDQNQQPLVNLNEMNVGLMIKGRSYDPMKRQYGIESIKNRAEAVRTVIVLDCSKSMDGEPFEATLKAFAHYIDTKRPQDQVALIAVRDTKDGYEVVSNFERDPKVLGNRLADIRCDGMRTRLYDAVGAAMQMCGMVSQGGVKSSDAEYIISSSIVVFSDGKDEGSALTREELNGRITRLAIPIPVYSVAYSAGSNMEYFKNLEALSKNSFGIYYNMGKSVERMQHTVEEIQNILQNDYVITFHAYQPVDGETHALKIGIEYPSRSGKMTYQGASFEAIQPPPMGRIKEGQTKLNDLLKPLPDNNPYLMQPGMEAAPAAPAAPAAK